MSELVKMQDCERGEYENVMWDCEIIEVKYECLMRECVKGE